MIIIISGNAGSGKSTISKKLAKKLGFDYISTGEMQRNLAKKLNLSIYELGKLEAKDKSYDLKIDNELVSYVKNNNGKNIVIDSWVASHFIKDAVKIFLTADLETRAKRILSHSRETERLSTIEDAKKEITKREETNQRRWLSYYGFDYMDKKNYDYIIDTTELSIEEVISRIEKIIKTIKEQQKQPGAR